MRLIPHLDTGVIHTKSAHYTKQPPPTTTSLVYQYRKDWCSAKYIIFQVFGMTRL